MHSILNLYVFLWKNKTIFFLFLIIVPLTSYFYLQNLDYKSGSNIKVHNYSVSKMVNNYAFQNATVIFNTAENSISTMASSKNLELSKKILNSVNQEVIADISYNTLKMLNDDVKEKSLNVASLLEKKKNFEKLRKNNELADLSDDEFKAELKVLDNLYTQELAEYQKADLAYKNYSLDKNTTISYYNPNKKTNYSFMFSVILALVLATIVSLLKSKFNNSYFKKSEIKADTNIKVLDGLTKFKHVEFVNNKLMAGKLKLSALTEISRIFKYITKNDKKTFAVISSVKNEGNSSLLYALAQHAAEHDNKVLVVDMNLRNMELSIKLTKTFEEWELKEHNFNKVYEKTINLTKNLDFLPALKDEDSLQLLKSSKNVKEFIENLKQHYDYVFIDTTAVLSVNINNIDSVILSEAVDGVVLNYLANKTKKSVLIETIDKINMMSDSNILAIITNNRYNPRFKDDLLAFCSYIEKIHKSSADKLRLKILKSYLLDEE